MSKRSSFLGDKGSQLLEEFLTLKQIGLLDGGASDDSMTKILGIMSLNSNRFMETMRDYIKQSKNDGGDGGSGGWRGRRRNNNNGQDFAQELQLFNSLNLQNVLGQVDRALQGVAAGPVMSNIASGYSLSQWGSSPANDKKLIAYILNTLNLIAYLMSATSQAERTEAFYALLESFEGSKMWGGSSNLGGILPLALLSGSGGGFFNFSSSLGTGQLQIPAPVWTV